MQWIAARKVFAWASFNATLITMLYYGYALNIEGAKNTALFIVWIAIIASLSLLNEDFSKAVKRGSSPVPSLLIIFVDIFIMVILAWNGAFITAFLWAIGMMIRYSAYKAKG